MSKHAIDDLRTAAEAFWEVSADLSTPADSEATIASCEADYNFAYEELLAAIEAVRTSLADSP